MVELNYGRQHYPYYAEMMDWCKSHIGPGGWNTAVDADKNLWSINIAFGHQHWKFLNEADAVAFKLVWG